MDPQALMGEQGMEEMGTPMSSVQKQQLLDLKNKIEAKKRELDQASRVGDAHLEETKQSALAQFFDAFQKAGIDPSDQNAMRAFFDKLYEENPDLYEMIIPIIDQILGPGAASQVQPSPEMEIESDMGMPQMDAQSMMGGGGGSGGMQ